jgi:hypothetical protein
MFQIFDRGLIVLSSSPEPCIADSCETVSFGILRKIGFIHAISEESSKKPLYSDKPSWENPLGLEPETKPPYPSCCTETDEEL